MIRLGLTGSIGMGKTATAEALRARGLPVWDADATVHALYAPGGAAVAPLAEVFPDAVTAQGVDRAALKAILHRDADALKRLEAIVHPLVAADRAAFAEAHASDPIAVFDIPLLFETGADAQMDRIAVVSTDAATQRARVLARPGMTEDTLAMILARQMPDREKRHRADYIIRTDTFDTAAADIDAMLADLRGQTE